jgi:hypothetical protein
MFSLHARYYHGLNVPLGMTFLQLRIDNTHFYSKSYQWLVVSGDKAVIKGAGKVNGHGDYGFLVSVIDGKAPGGGGDKFRIRSGTRPPATSSMITRRALPTTPMPLRA